MSWTPVRVVGLMLALALCLTLPARCVLGNSASPFPVDVQQPSGQSITLYLRGTEKIHWYEYVPEAANLTRNSLRNADSRELANTPGFTVVRDAQGRYVYATIDEQGSWAPTDRVVGREQPATQKRRLMPPPEVMARMAVRRLPERGLPPRAAAPAGEVRNLVVLMKFADHADRDLPSRQDFDTLFNAVGGDPNLAPTGSVQDFYRENSYTKMTLQSTVLDWVTLPENEAYYANGASGLDVRVREAMVDALNILEQEDTVDFSEFDNENGGTGDGWIDAITFVHSGYAAEFGGVAGGADAEDRIWSHRWVINTWTDPDSGVRVRDYNINPGIWGTSGFDIGHIGVICHEIGHFFGLPDLYDYSGRGEGVGSWCLMANSWGFDGSQLHPPHMSAWSKIFLGWNTAETVAADGIYDVPAAALPEAKIYRMDYPAGNPDEYLLIENRQSIGNFDGGIPAGTGGRGGLAIWQIDDAKTANDTPGFPGQPGWPENGNHYWVALLQADGKYELEKGADRGDADDVYRTGHVDSISPSTTPTSNSYTGLTGPTIHNISASSNVMTFQLGNPTPPAAAKFAGIVNIEVPESHVANFSDDGRAATLLFDHLYSSSFGSDHARTTDATFVLPLKDGAAQVHVDLRGYVSADEGSSASLVVQSGGVAQVVDLESARDESLTEAALRPALKKGLEQFREATGLAEGFLWTKRLEVQVPEDASLTVTTVLITEKQVTSSAGAFLVIDSLDAEIER